VRKNLFFSPRTNGVVLKKNVLYIFSLVAEIVPGNTVLEIINIGKFWEYK
jgi:hypothetical protein